jgi:WD40 repeat protein
MVRFDRVTGAFPELAGRATNKFDDGVPPIVRLGKCAIRACVALGCLLLFTAVPAQEPKLRSALFGHTKEVYCVAFSRDCKTMASGGADNSIRFWDVASGKERACVEKAAVFGVDSLAFSPNGKALASGTGGNRVTPWDVATCKSTKLLNKHSEYTSHLVVFSPDGKTLASGGQCIQEIRVWDPTTGKQTATLEGHDVFGVGALAFSRDGKTLVSVGFHDAQIKHVDLATGKNTATLEISDWTPAAAFSPEGKTLATAIYIVGRINAMTEVTENRVKLWDAATGKQRASLPAASVSSVVFSRDGKTLATGSEENTIKLWDLASGKELVTLKGHTDTVSSLAFSADGKLLVSGSKDKTVKVWELGKKR